MISMLRLFEEIHFTRNFGNTLRIFIHLRSGADVAFTYSLCTIFRGAVLMNLLHLKKKKKI